MIYLDHNATTPLRPAVKDVLVETLDVFGNPSSIHKQGRAARQLLEQAREDMARGLGVAPAGLTFTSSATEANNLALTCTGVETVLIAAIEHPASLKCPSVTAAVPVDAQGVLDLAALDSLLTQASGAAVVSVMLVNNETGVIQPLQDIAAITRKHNALLHSDLVQAVGRLDLTDSIPLLDMFSVSAHKIGGPKGIGALYIRDGLFRTPLLYGGGQERNRRPGTESPALATAFAKAVYCALAEQDHYAQLAQWREDMERTMLAACPAATIASHHAPRVGNTTMIAVPDQPAETQLMRLDLAGFAVSSGSACSSGKVEPSHVLTAMGMDKTLTPTAIRISSGWSTTEDDVRAFTKAFCASFA